MNINILIKMVHFLLFPKFTLIKKYKGLFMNEIMQKETSELIRKIRLNIKNNSYSFEHKGHYQENYQNGKSIDDFLDDQILKLFATNFEEDDLYILRKIANLDESNFYLFVKNDFPNSCIHCGEELSLLSNGLNFKIITSCKGKYLPYSVKINTKSKKVVVTNDLRKFFPEHEKFSNNHDLCTFTGELKNADDFSKINLGYIFTGNQPLHVLKDKNNILIKKTDCDNINLYTDLWAVCFADYDDLLQRMKRYYNLENINDLNMKFFIFDVSNDVIEIKSHLYENNNEIIISISS